MKSNYRYHYLNIIINTVIDFFSLFKKNKIYISGYIIRNNGKIEHNNWGDDINIYFIKYISKLNPIPTNYSLLYKILPIKNYLCIGSVIGWYDNKHMEIWGSGVISPDIKMKNVLKIHSVRGPLTRNVLLKQNITCPKIYGDPALLMSKFYTPISKKRYKLGIIPHFIDFDLDCISSLKDNQDILIIKMQDYSDWREIPEQICSCEKIISSSLHGLIISDSYQIPNKWVKFSDNIRGGSFKYQDYYYSVCRYKEKPIHLTTKEDILNLLNSKSFQFSTQIDYKSIIDSCPFKSQLKQIDLQSLPN